MSDAVTQTPAGGDVTAEDLQKLLADVRGQLDRTTQERDTYRERAQTVEREREDLAQRHLSEKERSYQSDLRAVEGHVQSAEADLSRAKQMYKMARDAGNVDDEVEAQAAIADATARRREASNRKQYLEANKESFTTEPARVSTTSDPYERIGLKGLMPGERSWLDARPKFLTDPGYQRRVGGAAQIAAQEFARDSQGYFDRIEEILGEKQADGVDPPPARTQRPSADIPPARRSGASSPSGAGEIRLSADEVEVADAMYGNPTQHGYIADQAERYRHYAAQKQRLRESGRL